MATDSLPHASIIGAVVPRIDGPLKTSGTARYACDHNIPGLAHAVRCRPRSATEAFAASILRRQKRCQACCTSCTTAIMEGVYRTISHDEDGTWPSRALCLTTISIILLGPVRCAGCCGNAGTGNRRSAGRPRGIRRGTARRTNRSRRWFYGSAEEQLETRRSRSGAFHRTGRHRRNLFHACRNPQSDGDARHRCRLGWRQPDALRELAGRGRHRIVMSEVLGVPRENVRVISRFIGSGFGGKLFRVAAIVAGRGRCTPAEAARQSSASIGA